MTVPVPLRRPVARAALLLAVLGALFLLVLLGVPDPASPTAGPCQTISTGHKLVNGDTFGGDSLPAGTYDVTGTTGDAYDPAGPPRPTGPDAQLNEAVVVVVAGVPIFSTVDVPDPADTWTISAPITPTTFTTEGGQVVLSHVGGDGPGSVLVDVTFCLSAPPPQSADGQPVPELPSPTAPPAPGPEPLPAVDTPPVPELAFPDDPAFTPPPLVAIVDPAVPDPVERVAVVVDDRTAAAEVAGVQTLPVTGDTSGWYVLVGAVLVTAGVGLLVARRRPVPSC